MLLTKTLGETGSPRRRINGAVERSALRQAVATRRLWQSFSTINTRPAPAYSDPSRFEIEASTYLDKYAMETPRRICNLDRALFLRCVLLIQIGDVGGLGIARMNHNAIAKRQFLSSLRGEAAIGRFVTREIVHAEGVGG